MSIESVFCTMCKISILKELDCKFVCVEKFRHLGFKVVGLNGGDYGPTIQMEHLRLCK